MIVYFNWKLTVFCRRQTKISTSSSIIGPKKKRVPSIAFHSPRSLGKESTWFEDENPLSASPPTPKWDKTDSSLPASSVLTYSQGFIERNTNLRQHSASFDGYSPIQNSGENGSKKMRRTPRNRNENHQCPNCSTFDSPLWRNCLIKGKILHLCNSCGLRYKKHKYCPHCYKVYYDAETNVQDWCQCISCHNWTHKQCLIDSGNQKVFLGPYQCLRCLGLLLDCE